MSLNLLRRLVIQNKTILHRNYVVQTNLRLQKDDNTSHFDNSFQNTEFNIGNILSSKKLETPPILSVPGLYRCSVNNPVNIFKKII